MTKSAKKPDQTIAQAITRAMNGGAPLTAAELAKMTPAERKGVMTIVAQNNAAIKAGKAQAITDPKLTGVPTEAQKTKARATAKGPKAGSAQSSQSVKYSEDPKPSITRAKQSVKAAEAKAPKPDVITSVKGTTSGPDHIVVVAGDNTVLIPRNKLVADLNKLARVGGSLKAVQEYLATHKQPAKLAHGITGRDAPHSAAAAAESNRAPKPAPVAKVVASKKTEARNPKGAFSYTIGKPADRTEGTWTQHMLAMIQSATDTDKAIANHAKSGKFADKKLHFSWARDKGYIGY